MKENAVASAVENPLRLDADGIRRIEGARGPLSYPAEGNRLIREVEDASWWFGHRTAVILTLFRRFPPAGPVWDLGGGNGLVAKALQDTGRECVLVEAGEEGCRNARARGVENVLCADLAALRFRPRSLDAAGLFDVLEHFADPRPLLERLGEALKPGRGKLYITVPAHRWLWSREDAWAGHAARYEAESLGRTLQGAGLEVDFLTYFFAWLSPFIFFGRTLPDKLRPRAGRRPGSDLGSVHGRRRGLAGWLADRRFAAEGRRIAHGRLSHGASLFAVCGRPPAPSDP